MWPWLFIEQIQGHYIQDHNIKAYIQNECKPFHNVGDIFTIVTNGKNTI